MPVPPPHDVQAAALGALREAAEELRDRGTYGYLERTANGVRAARSAFGS